MSYIVKRAVLKNGNKQFGTGLKDRIVVGNNTFANNFMPLDAVDERRYTKIKACGHNYSQNQREYGFSLLDANQNMTLPYGAFESNREDVDMVKPMMLQSSVMSGPRLNKNETNSQLNYGQFGNPKGAPVVMVIDDSGEVGDWLKEGEKYFMSHEGLMHQIMPDGKIEVKKWDTAYLDGDCYYMNKTHPYYRINRRLNKTVPLQLGTTSWSSIDPQQDIIYYVYNGSYNHIAQSRYHMKGMSILSSQLIGQDEKYIYYEQVFGGSDDPSSNYKYGTYNYTNSSHYPSYYKNLVAVCKKNGAPHWIQSERYSPDSLAGNYINYHNQGRRYHELQVRRLAVNGEAYFDENGDPQTGTGSEQMYEDIGGGNWQPIYVQRVFIWSKDYYRQTFYMIDPNLLSTGEPNHASTQGPIMKRLWSLDDPYYNHAMASEVVQSRENPDEYYFYTPYGSNQYMRQVQFEAKSNVSTTTKNADATLGNYPARYAGSTSYINNSSFRERHDSRNCLIIEEGTKRYLMFFTAGIRHAEISNPHTVTSVATGESATYGQFLIWQIVDGDEDALIFKSDIADWSYRKRFAGWVARQDNKKMLFYNETGLHMLQWNAAAEEMAALDPIAMDFIQGIAIEDGGENTICWVEKLLPADMTDRTTMKNTCQNGDSEIYQLQFGDYTDIDIRYIVEGDPVEYHEFTSKTMPTEKDSTTGEYLPKQLEVKVRVKTSIDNTASAFDDNIAYELQVSGGNKETDGLYWEDADVDDNYKVSTTSSDDWQSFMLNYRDPLDKIVITATLV